MLIKNPMKCHPPVVVDIDMTLTSEWYVNDKVSDVRGFDPMVRVILDLQGEGVPIVVSTARPERLRRESEEWINGAGIFPSDLLMRGHHDNRPDHLIKDEHAKSILRKYGSISIWYDDNKENGSVIESLGIQFFLVNQGNKRIGLELQASKIGVLRGVKTFRERKGRKTIMTNMCAFNSSAASLTSDEQEQVALFMVEQLKSLSDHDPEPLSVC